MARGEQAPLAASHLLELLVRRPGVQCAGQLFILLGQNDQPCAVCQVTRLAGLLSKVIGYDAKFSGSGHVLLANSRAPEIHVIVQDFNCANSHTSSYEQRMSDAGLAASF